MPDKTKKLHAKLLAWRAELKAPKPTKNTEKTRPLKEPNAARRRGKPPIRLISY